MIETLLTILHFYLILSGVTANVAILWAARKSV